MPRLATLTENRSKLTDQLEARMAELEKVLEERAWTPEEEQSLKDLRGRITTFDTLIAEAETEERLAREQQEERDRKTGGRPGVDDLRVGKEPLTYGPESPDNSYYRDLLFASQPTSKASQDALARLRRHQEEMDGIRSHQPGSAEGRSLRKYDQDSARSAEQRAVSTGASSMGDFAPPLYFLSDYAPFRTYGRTLLNCLKSRPLPETGMTFSVPKVTTPTLAVNQTATGGENTSVATRDMTSTYQTGTLQTVIDNLLVSQQYLDRVGPGVDGDIIVRDDQNRQINRSLNLYAWQSLFASLPVSGSSLLYNDTSFNATKFKHVMHGAKAAIRKTDGIVSYPTTFVGDADLWEQIEGAYDLQNRPLTVPQGVAFNPLAVGDESNAPEGYTGFRLASLPAFADESMWLAWNGGAASAGYANDHVGIVADFDNAAWWMESTPVVRVLPQPYAAQLTVLIQSYVYCAFIDIYPQAMQLIFGTGTADSFLTSY